MPRPTQPTCQLSRVLAPQQHDALAMLAGQPHAVLRWAFAASADDRQAGRQADRQTDRQTGRQAGWQLRTADRDGARREGAMTGMMRSALARALIPAWLRGWFSPASAQASRGAGANGAAVGSRWTCEPSTPPCHPGRAPDLTAIGGLARSSRLSENM